MRYMENEFIFAFLGTLTHPDIRSSPSVRWKAE